MTLLNPTLSRRTFLGGAGATLALTSAHTAAAALISRGPLPVSVLLCGMDALSDLESTLVSPAVDLRAVLISDSPPARESPRRLLPKVRRMLQHAGSTAIITELDSGASPRQPATTELELPILMLGTFASFPGSQAKYPERQSQSLSRWLRRSPSIYVDHPPLVQRMTSLQELARRRPRIVPGLCSVLDPAVDFALQHICSGAIGEPTQIQATVRVNDTVNPYEAEAIYRRLSVIMPGNTLPLLRSVQIGFANPTISICGKRGKLQIPLYSARERHNYLEARLNHFASQNV